MSLSSSLIYRVDRTRHQPNLDERRRQQHRQRQHHRLQDQQRFIRVAVLRDRHRQQRTHRAISAEPTPARTAWACRSPSITTNFTPGQIQTTGVDTEHGDQRKRIFRRARPPRASNLPATGRSRSTRNNQLVTAGGAFVQGYGADSNGNIIAGTASEPDDSHRAGDHRRRHAERDASGQSEFRRRRRQRRDDPHQPGVQHRPAARRPRARRC